ncbi:MAG: hypothetical protein M0R51_10840 [Clostridia bacterium]|jgi:hypothetical protein|nr:hypothetical protein [Clostridia bacterium]
MADHKIYIYAREGDGVGISNKTTPNLSKESETGFDIQQVAGFVKSPVSAGISSLAKASAFVAAGIVAVKVADQMVSTVGGLYESYSGDSRFTLPYANFKKQLGYVFNPFSYAMDSAKQYIQFHRENSQKEQMRILAGISVNNAAIGGRNV